MGDRDPGRRGHGGDRRDAGDDLERRPRPRTSASASSPPRPNTNGSPPLSRTTSSPVAPVGDEQLVDRAPASSGVAVDHERVVGRLVDELRRDEAVVRRARRSARISSSPRAVISPGSPGPAPTSRTVMRAPPRRAARSSRAGPRRSAGSRFAHGRSARSRRASSACSGPISSPICVADPLRERGRGAAGRDGDRDRPLAVDGGEDERAELGHVDDVAEEVAPPRRRRDAPVDAGVARWRRRRGSGRARSSRCVAARGSHSTSSARARARSAARRP